MQPNRKITVSKFKLLPFTAALVLTGIRTAGAADYPTTILADNPVAYYRLEEASGSAMVDDSSGHGFTGFVNYITQADGITIYPQLGLPGIDTNSALFATSTGIGQGDIDVPYDPALNPTTDGTNGAPFTAEIWVQATAQSSGYGVPLDNSCNFAQPPPWNNSAGWNFYETAGPGSTWSFSLRPNPGFVGNGPAVTVGQWTHLVLSYNGTNATFYVNGVAFGTYAVPQYLANPGTGSASDLLMGEGPNTGQVPFDGGVDEVAVYNYALSATQVTNHYMVGTNSIRVLPTPPSFVLQPSSASSYAGVPVTFSAQASGTAPLSYQWARQGSGPIPNATNTTYTITPVYPGDNEAGFYVTVTNSVGHTNSAIATLTVETNLNLNYNPFSITRRVGSHAAFRVVANGALPITYQWHGVSNSTDQVIAGATSDTLWLSNVQASANGTVYYAQVNGPFGSALSGQATLSIIARPTNSSPTTAYSAIVMADNPVAYWRLDEPNGSTNAVDSVGSFDGTYSSIGTDLTFGYPTGIPKDIDTAIHVTNTAIVTIPYALEINPVSGPWSYEFWIQPTSLSGNFPTPISSEANPNMGANLTGWNIYQHQANVWTWNIYNGSPNGSFTSEFADNPIVPGTWYDMVLTDDGTNLNWYSNNRLVLTESVSGLGFIQNGVNGDPSIAAGPTTLAIRSDGVFGGWDGGIEDVAVYNYVLNAQQIQSHFLNSPFLTAVSSGGNLILNWPVGGILQSATAVSGPYTNVNGATPPYSTPISLSAPHVFYRVNMPQ
jgi:Concanavalin A-like lectin/glucanases superfamily